MQITDRSVAVLAMAYVLVLGVFAYTMGWHEFMPILGTWEHFEFYYGHGAVDPHLSFAISPRANLGGKGYPLLDLGIGLANWIGLTLSGFRAFVELQAIACAGLMLIILSRWFGLVAALFGVTLTVFSTGFITYANQVLVLMPTLLLSLLLIERCQYLNRHPDSSATVAAISLIVAFLIMQYGLGRYFAVGWLGFFFALRAVLAWHHLPSGAPLRDYLGRQVCLGLGIIAVGLLILCILDFNNIRALGDPMNVFFRRRAREIEMDAVDLLPTVIGNIPLALEMLFPFIKVSGGGQAEILTTAFRAPLLNTWHAPFLVLGAAVSLRRAFRRDAPAEMPYLALHVVFLLSVGISLFSEQMGEVKTLSPARVFLVYIAVAGYISVAAQWLLELSVHWPQIHRQRLVMAGALAAIAAAAFGMTRESRQIAERVDAMAAIRADGGAFEEVKLPLDYGYELGLYQQARFRKLAALLGPALDCRSDEAYLLQINPRLLLNKGRYDGLHYIRFYNDLSTTLALYLGGRTTMNPAFVIVHSRDDRGARDWGHGYGGRPRVFSGPIVWEGRAIEYSAEPPLAFELRKTGSGQGPLLIVTFSETEAEAARTLAGDSGLTLSELPPVSSLKPFTAMSRMAVSDGTPSLCPTPAR